MCVCVSHRHITLKGRHFWNKIIIECLCDKLTETKEKHILKYFCLICKLVNTSTTYRKLILILKENVNLLSDN